MKHCPACKTNYTDETLSYCLSDGQPLVSAARDFDTVVSRTGEATAVFAGREKMRVEIPQETATSIAAAPGFGQSVPAPSSGGLKIFVGVLAVILVLAAIAVVGGLAFYFGSSGGDIASNNNRANRELTTPSPSATKDDKEELRQQIANLERRLNEQQSANKPANITPTLPNRSTTTTTARVNSPGDGFLALRSLPNSETGERIVKIPHGATISIGACGTVTRPVSRAGRWCQTTFNGYSGWVFDAYLVY